MTQQPEALALADTLANFRKSSHLTEDGIPLHRAIEAELHRMHTAYEALRSDYADTLETLEDHSANAVVIQYHEATIKRLEKTVVQLLEALEWVERRCPAQLLLREPHSVHKEAAFDAGVCARAAIAAAKEQA